MKQFLAIILSLILIANVFAQDQEKESADIGAKYKNEKFFAVQGAKINSLGHFAEGWKDGSAGYVTYGVVYDDNWSLILQTGYITFNANHEETVYQGDVEPKFDIIPLMVGTRYYAMRGVVRPFLFGMGGQNPAIFRSELSRRIPQLNEGISLGGSIVNYFLEVTNTKRHDG